MSNNKSNARELKAERIPVILSGSHYAKNVLVMAARCDEPEKAKQILNELKMEFSIHYSNSSLYINTDENTIFVPTGQILVYCNGVLFTMPEKVFDTLFAPTNPQ
jgi:hypothetical protein